MIFIAIVFGQQSKSGLELEESIVQKLAKADAKEDFNSGLKWSGISIAAFIGGFYVVVNEMIFSNEEMDNLMGGTIATVSYTHLRAHET